MCGGVTEDHLIEDIFGHYLHKGEYNKMQEYVILAPRNDEVHNINEKIISRYDYIIVISF